MLSTLVPGGNAAPLRATGRRREAGSDALSRGGLWEEVVSNFSSPSPHPAKMSDMEDDFMCDDEEDYDLVRRRGRNAGTGDGVWLSGPGLWWPRPFSVEHVPLPACPGVVTGRVYLLPLPAPGLGPASPARGEERVREAAKGVLGIAFQVQAPPWFTRASGSRCLLPPPFHARRLRDRAAV